MVMLILPLLATCLLISQTSAITYDNVNKTAPIVVQEYADQAAQNIRAIARSYMHNLMLNEQFSEYFTKVYDKYKSEEIDEFASWYSKTYWAHVAAVGIGLVVALMLLLSIWFLWICCCCCNKSQKTTYGMACWRMTWGVLALILLALNVAGIAIGAISLQNTSTMDKKINDTIDNLSEGAVKYLDGTEGQVKSIQSGAVAKLLAELKPLVSNVIDSSVEDIRANTSYVTSKDGIVNTLNGLNTTVDDASDAVNNLLTSITSLEGLLSSLNTDLTNCKSAIDTCKSVSSGNDATVIAACSNVKTSEFQSFDTSKLKKSEIVNAQTTIGKISTIDGKTLLEWSAEVEKLWLDMDTTVNDKSTSTIKEFTDMIDELSAQVDDAIDNTLSPEIATLTDNITSQATELKDTMQQYSKFYKAAFMMQEIDKSDYPNVDPNLLDNAEFTGYGMIALVALVGGLLLLLFLNILCGLSGIIFGCCKVSDDVPPTDRDSGTCGTMLMCTSYCSVFLCAVATLVAALILTFVMLQEGVCKEYSKGTLLTSVQTLTEKYNWINITQKVEEATDIRISGLQDIMTGCESEETVFKVLDLDKNSLIMGKNLTVIQEDMLAKISADDITAEIDNVDFTFTILDDSTKNTLTENKDDLTPIDYTTTAATLDDANTDISDLDALISTLTTIEGMAGVAADTKTAIETCRTQMTLLKDTTTGQIDAIKSSTKVTMLSMADITASASDGITYLVDNATKLQDDMFGTPDENVKNLIKRKVVAGVGGAKQDVRDFVTYIVEQLQTTVGSCQPIYAVYATALNYTCDGVFIHFSLMWASLSLIGISLLLYMCVARCLARYFIKFPYLHPADHSLSTTNIIKNDWNNGYEMSSPMSNRVGTTVTKF